MAVLTVSEAKAYLNITDADDDYELSDLIDRAEAALASRTGPLSPLTVTARVRGYGSMLSPKVTPILSLTSVTPVGGSALDVNDMVLPENGLRGPKCIEMYDRSSFSDRWYDVTYQAGRDTTPEDLRLAALEAVRHYWQSQLGNASTSQGALPSGESEFMPAGSFPWSRVQHLIEPHEQVWI